MPMPHLLRLVFSLSLPFLPGLATLAQSGAVTPQGLLEQAGIPSTPEQRGQMDTTGFSPTAEAMDKVLARSLAAASERENQLGQEGVNAGENGWVAALCPHDDYGYAGRFYALLLAKVRAPRVIVFGVFHKAKAFKCQDKLVFDAFPVWRGPYGPIKISPLREEVLRRFPEADRVVDNDMHAVEHSVEAIAYFLQTFNRKVEIVPVLVPYMDWKTLERLAGTFAETLAAVLQEKGWVLGRDVALVCSTDGVHYGDAGWGATNYCPFGADLEGYRKAAAQDREIAASLAGVLDPEKPKRFFACCVDPADVTRYRVTWCGRFSVPFGLRVVENVRVRLGAAPLTGYLLDVGTSVSEAGIPVTDLRGMGLTAPSNFHHFVGYCAMGWK